jgi:hypothetical protein
METTVTRRNRGTGGIYRIEGSDPIAVKAKANEVFETIDYMQSPLQYELSPTVIEIKYYGLD